LALKLSVWRLARELREDGMEPLSWLELRSRDIRLERELREDGMEPLS